MADNKDISSKNNDNKKIPNSFLTALKAVVEFVDNADNNKKH